MIAQPLRSHGADSGWAVGGDVDVGVAGGGGAALAALAPLAPLVANAGPTRTSESDGAATCRLQSAPTHLCAGPKAQWPRRVRCHSTTGAAGAYAPRMRRRPAARLAQVHD